MEIREEGKKGKEESPRGKTEWKTTEGKGRKDRKICRTQPD